jgi:hypothetical protein
MAPRPFCVGRKPAHWGVTGGVDDADATAERATELGGRVVVAPFDAPWVRMTVITDPQGATPTQAAPTEARRAQRRPPGPGWQARPPGRVARSDLRNSLVFCGR